MKDSQNSELISLSQQVRYRAVGEDGVLVHLNNGRVIVVNEVGLYILQLLDTPITPKKLANSIAFEFNVSPMRAKVDLVLFLAELDKEQVLKRHQ